MLLCLLIGSETRQKCEDEDSLHFFFFFSSFLFFWLNLWHVEVPGTEPTPEQQPEPQHWQHLILNPLYPTKELLYQILK